MIETFNFAAIDIGSNAARMLIKSVKCKKEENGFKTFEHKKLQFLRIPLRLGIDVFSEGKICDEREKKLFRTMKIFRHLLSLYDVKDFRACATSAFRDAKNGKKIIKEIRKDLDIDLEIVTGEEEAKIIRDNHIQNDNNNYLYMDVGGGSTEISIISQGKLIAARSYNIGTLRLLNGTVSNEQWINMMEDVKEITKGFDDIQIIGTGGNINKLYRMISKSDKKSNSKMTVESLNKLHQALASLTVEERMEKYNLRDDRADVIVPAASLFLTIATLSNAKYIIVPTIGLTDGIINQLAERWFV